MTSDRPVVFVVDDDARVRDALSSLLASAGLEVAVFASATEFLQADKPDAPACLVLDLELPDIHGLELQKELAEREAPPIVFITGHGDIPSSVKAMKAGAVEFLSKPFGDEELLRAIDAAIALDRAARLKRSERLELRAATSGSRLVNAKCSPSSSPASPTSRLPASSGPARSPSASIVARSCARWARDPSPSWSGSPTSSGSRPHEDV